MGFAYASAEWEAATIPCLVMSFTTLLKADIGMAMLPMLNLKVLLLCFMPLCRKCTNLTRWKLVTPGTLSGDSAIELHNLLYLARIATACADVAGLPKRVTELIIKTNSLHLLHNQAMQHYFYQLNDAMYRYWNQLPLTPNSGVSQAILSSIGAKIISSRTLSLTAYQEDMQYWKTSRAVGEFTVLFNRYDGTVLVSKDCSRVYLLRFFPSSISTNLQEGEFFQQEHAPILHGCLQARRVYGSLVNWQGLVVQDGALYEPTRPPLNKDSELLPALRAYQHAVDTNTMITTLPKIPPAAAMVPTLPCSAEQFCAKYKDLVRIIADQPPAVNSQFFAKWTVRAPSLLVLCIEFGDGNKASFANSQLAAIAMNHLFAGSPAMSWFVGDILSPVPTISHYLMLLASMAEDNRGRPKVISVDSEDVFYKLQLLLHGIATIQYEVPLLPNEQDAFMHAVELYCIVCASTESLRCCGECGLVHYCGKEHQKKHWKEHKSFCQQFRK